MPKTTITDKMQRKLEAMKHDNLTPVYRAAAYGQRMLKELSSWYWGVYDSRLGELPGGLQLVEKAAAQRISNPKSIYQSETFRHECETLGQSRTDLADADVATALALRKGLFKDLSSGPLEFKLPAAVANKSSGAPDFITKRDWFNLASKKAFLRNLWNTLRRGKIDMALDMVYASFSGSRTQQSKVWKPPKQIEGKIRVINMVPAELFYIEYRIIRGCIDKAKELFNIGAKFPVYVYYVDMSETARQMGMHMKAGSSVTVLDMKAFDHYVRDYEQDADYLFAGGDNVFTQFLRRYANTAPLIHPWGILSRKEGRLSGLVSTNIFNCLDNVADVYQAAEKAGLSKFILAIFVNGDDICIIWRTVITEKEIARIAKFMGRFCDVEKCWYSTKDAFYCKRYWWDGKHASAIAKAINSIAFTERDSSIIKAGKEYVWFATAQIVKDVGKDHPWHAEFQAKVSSLQKYKYEDLDKSRLTEAATKYFEDRKTTGDEDVPDKTRLNEAISEAREIIG